MRKIFLATCLLLLICHLAISQTPTFEHIKFSNPVSNANFITGQYEPMIYGSRSGGGIPSGSSSLIFQVGTGYSDRHMFFRTADQTRLFIHNNGNLGVNTTTPASLAHFVFNQNHTTFGATASYLVLSNANTTPQNLSGIAFSSNAAGTGTSLISARHNRDTNNSGRLILYNRNSGGGFYPGLTIKEDNTVGIGTTEPDKTLTLQAATATYLNIKTNTRELLIGSDHNGGVISTMTNDDLYLRTGGNIDRMVIKANGNVGIGTLSPGDDQLAVNGTIKAKEVKVTIDGWSDFVFEEDYELMPLEEVETYIKQNKHLPEIPSAKEVEENGVNLGTMDAKLLQKIEELTLYMIEQGKQIESLKKENEVMKNEIKALINN